MGILQQARSAAFDLVAGDPLLELPEVKELKKIMITRWKGRFELVGTG